MNHFLTHLKNYKKMKNRLNYSTLLVIVTILFFGSCARVKSSKSTSAKKIPAKTSQVNTAKDKTNTAKTQEEEVTTKVMTTEIIETETITVVTDKTVAISPNMAKPSKMVMTNFNKEYPSAISSVWNTIVPESKNGKMYLVSFMIGTNRNSSIFTEKGIEVERRSEILPVQLPQNVYDAIRNKYNDAEILSASTYNSTLSKGNYATKVKSEAFAVISEFILTDKGEFIEQ
jgi:hypothetical protein